MLRDGVGGGRASKTRRSRRPKEMFLDAFIRRVGFLVGHDPGPDAGWILLPSGGFIPLSSPPLPPIQGFWSLFRLTTWRPKRYHLKMQQFDSCGPFRGEAGSAPWGCEKGSTGNGRRLAVALVVATALCAIPCAALGYALVGDGRISRVDAVLVWDVDRQVLALLPHIRSVGEGAVLIVPVPEGAELVVAPDPEMFSAPETSLDDEDDDGERDEVRAEDGSLEGDPREQREIRGKAAELIREDRPSVKGLEDIEALRRRGQRREGEQDRGAARRSGEMIDRHRLFMPEGSRKQSPPVDDPSGLGADKPPKRFDGPRGKRAFQPLDRARLISALRRRQPPLVRPDEDPVVLSAKDLEAALSEVEGEDWSAQLPAEALQAYKEAGWHFLLARLPEREGRMRFGPLAFSMPASSPTIPIRLAAQSGPHLLSLRFISHEEIGELGVDGEAMGLRHTQRPTPVDAALRAWLIATGFDEGPQWRARGLAAGPLNTESHSLVGAKTDLVIPVPVADVETEPEADTEAAKTRRSRSSCGCLAASSQGPFGPADSFWVVFLLLAFGVLGARRGSKGYSALGSHGREVIVSRLAVGPCVAAMLLVFPSSSLARLEVDEGIEERHKARSLTYPEATEEGSQPPLLRLASGGAPIALFFPDERLDPRGEVHFVTKPNQILLRIAERTAYIETTSDALPGLEALATITLSDGKPLSFSVRVVGAGEQSDATVEVGTSRGVGQACVAELTEVRDELAECLESSGDRAVALVAGLLIEASDGSRPVEHRTVRQRDKQNRIYVELLDVVRLYQHTYLRVRLENRDGSRKVWAAGEPTLTVVGPGPRRMPLQIVSIFEQPAIDTGASTLLVLGVRTPQLATGASLRLALHEADGQRHVVLEPLRI